LSASQRYHRQTQFGPIGNAGQQRLAGAHVSILGCGALGSVAAEILARSGVGRLRLIDRDVVEWSNLQRQSLYDERDAREGRAKAAAACEKLATINSTLEFDPHVVDVTADNISSLLAATDLVIDATDNFSLRFLLNDWSLLTQTPWVHGGCVGASGQVRFFSGKGQPCFRCFVPELPSLAAMETCDTAGVVASATHVIASLQAGEAIKWLCGDHEAIETKLLSLDLWHHRIRRLDCDPARLQHCRACRHREWDFLAGDSRVGSERIVALCGRDAFQFAAAPQGNELNLSQIATRWNGLGRVQCTRFFARLFPDDQHSLTIFRDGRTVVSGTTNVQRARALYDRFIGS